MSTLPKSEKIEITADTKSWARKALADCENYSEIDSLIRGMASDDDNLPSIHYLLTPKIQSWGAKTKDYNPSPDSLMPALYRAAEYQRSFGTFCYVAHYMKDNFPKETCQKAFNASYGQRVMRELMYYSKSEHVSSVIDMFDIEFRAVADVMDRVASEDAQLFEKCMKRYGTEKVFDKCSLSGLYKNGQPAVKNALLTYMNENSESDKVQKAINSLFSSALESTEPDLLKNLLADGLKPDFTEFNEDMILYYKVARIGELKKQGHDLFKHFNTTPKAQLDKKIEDDNIGSAVFSALMQWTGHGIDASEIPKSVTLKAIDDGEATYLKNYFEKSGNVSDYINDMMVPYAKSSGQERIFELALSYIKDGCDFDVNNTPIKTAIDNNEQKVFKRFLKMEQYDLSETDVPAMIYAFSLRHNMTLAPELKDKLLQCDMDASADKSALLKQAVQRSDLPLITYCFEHGAGIMDDGDNIMHEALLKNDKDLLQVVYKYAREDVDKKAEDWQNFASRRDKYISRNFIRELPKWKMVAEDEISRTTFPLPGDRDKTLTQVFNFSAKTVTTLFVNSNDKTSNMEVINFGQFQGDANIQKAFAMLIKMGGEPDSYERAKRHVNAQQNKMSLSDASEKKLGLSTLSIRK